MPHVPTPSSGPNGSDPSQNSLPPAGAERSAATETEVREILAVFARLRAKTDSADGYWGGIKGVEALIERGKTPISPAAKDAPEVQEKARDLARALLDSPNSCGAHYAGCVAARFLSPETMREIGLSTINALIERVPRADSELFENGKKAGWIARDWRLTEDDVKAAHQTVAAQFVRDGRFDEMKRWLQAYNWVYDNPHEKIVPPQLFVGEAVLPAARESLKKLLAVGNLGEATLFAKGIDVASALRSELKAEAVACVAAWLKDHEFAAWVLRDFRGAYALTDADLKNDAVKQGALACIERSLKLGKDCERLHPVAVLAGATPSEIASAVVSGLTQRVADPEHRWPPGVIRALRTFQVTPALLTDAAAQQLGIVTLATLAADHDRRYQSSHRDDRNVSEDDAIAAFGLAEPAQLRAGVLAITENLGVERGYNGTSGAEAAHSVLWHYKVPDSALRPGGNDGLHELFPAPFRHLFATFDLDTFDKVWKFCARGTTNDDLFPHLLRRENQEAPLLGKQHLEAVKQLHLSFFQAQCLVENGVDINALAQRRDFDGLLAKMLKYAPPYTKKEGMGELLSSYAEYFGAEHAIEFLNRMEQRWRWDRAGKPEKLLEIAKVSGLSAGDFYTRIVNPAMNDCRLWGGRDGDRSGASLLDDSLLQLGDVVHFFASYPVHEKPEVKIATNHLRVLFPDKASVFASWDSLAEFVVRYQVAWNQAWHGPYRPSGRAPLRDMSIAEYNGLDPKEVGY